MNQSLALERFALRWLQEQLADILVRGGSPACAFPADLPVSELPGNRSMRQLFAALRRRGVRVPPLMLSRFQFLLITGISIGLLVTSILNGLPAEQLSLMFLVGLTVWVLRLMFAQRFFAKIPTARTVGELAQQLLWQNPKYFSRVSGIPLTREQIKRIVIHIFAEVTGADESEITEETLLADLAG